MDIGKTLILLGLFLVIIGGVVMAAGKIPWLGRLPGDVMIKKQNFTFYFPLTTSILLSLVISLLLFLLNRK
jgi:uncharacterized membrane protein YvlD (DUF360 family)